MSDTKAKTVEIDTDKRIEEMLKQLVKMVQNMETNIMKRHEDMKKFLRDMNNDLKNSHETMKDSQETMKTELKIEVEMKVQVIEDKVHIVEETATSPKNEDKKEVKIIESEAEDNPEELKIENEWVDGVKPSGTTDSNKDATTDNSEHKPEYNYIGKAGESSGSVTADSSSDVSENEEETTNPQAVWEDLQLAKRIYQKRGEEDKIGLAGAIVSFGEVSLEGGNFESAVSDIKEGLRKQDEIAASIVQEQRKKLRRSQEQGQYSIVTELNDGVWRIPKRPRVKMRFVRLKLFEGSTDGVT